MAGRLHRRRPDEFALAWFLFSFAIFNTYMLIASMRVKRERCSWSSSRLEITEILLVIGFFNISHGGTQWWLHAGGWAGIVTAAVAWYASAAGVMNGVSGRVVLPVGRPLVTQPPAAATA